MFYFNALSYPVIAPFTYPFKMKWVASMSHSSELCQTSGKTYPVVEASLRLEPELAFLAVEVVVDPAAVKVVPAEHPILEPQPVPLVK